jgi:phosphatidylinositol alpha-1,6-mannosyltransferase
MERLMSQLVGNLRCYADVQVLGPFSDQEDTSAKEQRITRSRHNGLMGFAFDTVVSGIRLLRSHSYDVVIAGGSLMTPIASVLGRLFGLPVVVNVHGLDLIYDHPAYQWMIRSLLPRCDRVFAISHAAKKEACKRDVPPERVSVVHPGLDFSEFEIVPDVDHIKRHCGLQERSILLSAGRLAKRKGLVEFVKYSLPAIVEERPNTVFVIVGGNPTLSLTHKEDIESQIQFEADQLGLENHVRMLGWIDRRDLVALYHVCDLFVLPAIQVPGDIEGFGIVLIEASAAGRPVVSTKLGGITDAVEDGKSGILVEAGRWSELSDVILGLLADESARREMGQFGRERVQTEFDWPIVAGRYVEHLLHMLDVHH